MCSSAGDGQDGLRGGTGADLLEAGGAGIDTASYAPSASAPSGSISPPALAAGGDAQGDTPQGHRESRGRLRQRCPWRRGCPTPLRAVLGLRRTLWLWRQRRPPRRPRRGHARWRHGHRHSPPDFDSATGVTANLATGTGAATRQGDLCGHRERQWQPARRQPDRQCRRQCAGRVWRQRRPRRRRRRGRARRRHRHRPRLLLRQRDRRDGQPDHRRRDGRRRPG